MGSGQGETNLTTQMRESFDNSRQRNNGEVAVPDDLVYVNGIVLDNRLQMVITDPGHKLILNC